MASIRRARSQSGRWPGSLRRPVVGTQRKEKRRREDDTGQARGHESSFERRGVIAAAAMDQRGSLKKSLAKEKGGEVSDAMMEEFKILVTKC